MKFYPHQENGEIIELIRKDEHDAVVAELNERLTKQQADMLDTIVDLRADLTRYSAEREHNAMQALMWQSIAEKLANAGGWSAEPDSSWDSALADYESAKSGNLPDPLAEAVKRMEAVPLVEFARVTHEAKTVNGEYEAIRTRLISAAKGEQP